MTLRLLKIAGLIGAVSLMYSVPSYATLMTVNVTGSVTQVLTPDIFGTHVGEAITLHGIFDTNSLVDESHLFGINIPGLQFGSFAFGPNDALAIHMGGALGEQHWSAADEPSFGVHFFGAAIPHIVLLNGAFFGLNFFGIGPDHNTILSDSIGQLYFGSPPGEILGGNDDPNAPPFWIGSWDLANATVSVLVPEPSSLALMLGGLMALPLVRHRKTLNRAVRRLGKSA